MILGRYDLKHHPVIAGFKRTGSLVLSIALLPGSLLESIFFGVKSLPGELKRLRKKAQYRWTFGLTPDEQNLLLCDRGKRQIDFIGPIETYWSISVVNRHTIMAALKSG